METGCFEGAKVALFLGTQLCTILRDDIDSIPYPNMWDLPGGAREDEETPFACMQRETMEEVGLHVSEATVIWHGAFEEGGQIKWLFVAQMPETSIADVVLGDEGQCWKPMPVETFLGHPKAIPPLKRRVRAALDILAADGKSLG